MMSRISDHKRCC